MTDLTENSELVALISLLDEPDEKVYTRIQEKIFSFGTEAIGILEKVWENSFNSIVQERIEEIIKKIQWNNLVFDFTNWVNVGSSDLLKGFILVSKTQYPELDEENIITRVEQMRMDAWLEMNENLTALENVKVLNHIIYHINNFDGNKVNIHAPQNSYINTLLETRKGSPLSLGMLYMIISRKLNIPVYGINLPQHFVLAYVTEMVTEPTEHDVLFYINPFNRGTVFTRREIELFIRQLKLRQDPAYFTPCSNIDIIRRLLHNLVFSFNQLGYPDKIEELEHLLKITGHETV